MVPVLADGTPLCELPQFEHNPHAYVKLWKPHGAQPQADQPVLIDPHAHRHHVFRLRAGVQVDAAQIDLDSADEVVPLHHAAIEPEAPVRPASLGFELRTIRVGQRERGAIVDRRQAPRLLQLAAAVEFALRFVRRIQKAHRPEALGGRLIERDAVGLPHGEMRGDAEPGKVDLDAIGEFSRGALEIRVVETQNEAAASARGDEVVEQRRARIADVDAASGRRSETNDRT